MCGSATYAWVWSGVHILRCWSGVGLFCSADIFLYWRHHCTWSWVTVLGSDPSISLVDRETKGFAFHSHKHALHSRVSVQTNPGDFASELDFGTAHREPSDTGKKPFDVALHERHRRPRTVQVGSLTSRCVRHSDLFVPSACSGLELAIGPAHGRRWLCRIERFHLRSP